MRLIRQAAFAAALVAVSAAVFATVENTVHTRAATAQLTQARDYASIADEVGRQQRLVAAGASRDAAAESTIERLSKEVDRLLVGLQRRTRGVERAEADALALAYRAASSAAESSVRGAPANPGVANPQRAAEQLGAVRSRAAELRRWHGNALADRLDSPTATLERTTTALSAGTALLCIACLFVLGRRSRSRKRGAELALLKAAAHSDSLTGLGNHRSFHDDLTEAMRERATHGSTFALMAVDLDGLKQINDTEGHQAGDAHIRRASDCLKKAVKGDGTVYRIGGDEFMVLLPGRRSWHALAVARAVDQLTRIEFGRRALSIGITESTTTEARHVLIREADIALYGAKRTNSPAIVFYPAHTRRAGAAENAPSHQETLAAALARAVDAKDTGTRSHSETVAELSVAIGEQLGIRGERLVRLRRAGLLHDVGKIGVPDAILKKPASLDTDEQAEMKAHVSIGQAILEAAEMTLEANWVLHHHERLDGTGYPGGLCGNEIPLESRILAVADAFEAMTGARPYQAFLTSGQALAELERHADDQFDRACVDALCEIVHRTAAA